MSITDFELSCREYVSSKVKTKEELRHIHAVVDELSLPPLKTIAYFHDMIEDGYSTVEQLQKTFNLTSVVVDALVAITRRESETYFQYIDRVKNNSMASVVKMADLKDNMRRCIEQKPINASLLSRYAKAYQTLIGVYENDIEC